MILKADGKFDPAKGEVELSLEFQPLSEAEHKQLCSLLHGEVAPAIAFEWGPKCDLLSARLIVKRWEAPEDDISRCAVCGWPLAESLAEGCVRGNCSQRPQPENFYSPERAERERVEAEEPYSF